MECIITPFQFALPNWSYGRPDDQVLSATISAPVGENCSTLIFVIERLSNVYRTIIEPLLND